MRESRRGSQHELNGAKRQEKMKLLRKGQQNKREEAVEIPERNQK